MNSIEKINDLVGEILAASREQSSGVSEISTGLEQVNAVVQRNSSVAEETASASEQLRRQAQSLQELMENFRLKSDEGRPLLKTELNLEDHSAAFHSTYTNYEITQS